MFEFSSIAVFEEADAGDVEPNRISLRAVRVAGGGGGGGKKVPKTCFDAPAPDDDDQALDWLTKAATERHMHILGGMLMDTYYFSSK